MRSGETWIIVAVTILLAGALFTAFKGMPDQEMYCLESSQPVELSVYDQLKQDIQPYHFGNVPRESFSGDTTVWVVDLDHNMYSLPQANLHVTRILRRLGFNNILVTERAAGGMVFKANFPNDQPLQIHFTSP